MSEKTLQERLRDREGDNNDELIDAAADALDAALKENANLRNLIKGSGDLYQLLTDTSNGIDSPATCSIAASLLVRIDKLNADFQKES